MTVCSRCQTLPESLPESGVLYLAPPISPTAEVIRSYVKGLGLPWTEIYPQIYEIPIDGAHLRSLCADCLGDMGPMELADTMCLYLGEGESFDVRLLVKMQPLRNLVSRIQGNWLIDILREEALEAWFQPIVHASDPSRIFAYECLMRGRGADGARVYPGEMFGIARKADLLFQLDRLCRLTAVRDARAHDLKTNIFINFNPGAIYDPEHCLKTTMAAVLAAGMDAGRIVFEVVEDEKIMDADHLLSILAYYRRRGFKVAMDDLGAGYSSLNLLAKLKPDFIKMDVELIRDVDRDRYKEIIAANLLHLARELGVRVIAEGVERTAEWAWLKRSGADFIQGYLFAKPAATPPLPAAPDKEKTDD